MAQFEKFYAAYPRHEGKRAALEAFLEVNLSDPERVTAILEHQKVVKKQLRKTVSLPLNGLCQQGGFLRKDGRMKFKDQ
jgi:hypothetical protein